MTLLAGLFGPPVSSIIPKPSNLSFPFSIVAQSITNTFGLQKDVNEWQGYWDKDVLWGIQAGSSASFLMNVYFEKEFNRDLNEFRDSLGIRVYNE